MGDDLRVGFGLEGVAGRRQFVPELPEILDYAVVDNCDAACAIAVRVGVQVTRPSMSCPTSVAQPNSCPGRLTTQGFAEDSDLAGPLLHEKVAALGYQSYARGVVASILQASQPIEQDWTGVSRSRIADDSAHKQSSGLVTTAPQRRWLV